MADIKLPVDDNGVNLDTIEKTVTVEQVEFEGAKYNLDKEGNALNSDGSIFKSKEDLTKKPDDSNNDDNKDTNLETSEIEIDGKVYKLDNKGNAISNDGKIFMEKSKIDELSADDDSNLTGIEDITKVVNIQPVDQKGTPIVYENTVEGIAQYIADIREITRNEERVTAQQDFFTENPDLYAVYLHKLNTGTIEGFNSRVDWSTVDVEKAEEDSIINMIVANEVRKGTQQDRAEYLAKLIKADGKLKEQGVIAQQELVENNKEFEATALANKQKQDQADYDAEVTYWNNVEKSINSGKLKIGDTTYKLPQVYRIKTADGKSTTANNKDFLEYLTKPKLYTIEGQQYNLTGDAYDSYMEGQTKTHEDYIFEALKRFVKGDTSQFIQEQVKQELRKKIITTSKEGSKLGRSVNTSTTKELKLPVN